MGTLDNEALLNTIIQMMVVVVVVGGGHSLSLSELSDEFGQVHGHIHEGIDVRACGRSEICRQYSLEYWSPSSLLCDSGDQVGH